MTSEKAEITKKIRQAARNIGFTGCGITPAQPLPENARYLRKWLRLEMNAGMKFMEANIDKRTDPGKLFSGATSVIVVTVNYFPARTQTDIENNLLLAKYAYGRDYHRIVKAMLKKLYQKIKMEIVPCNGRIFVDSGPLLEKALAANAGLGWIGKNSGLISTKHGSFLFIGELVVDIPLQYDKPINDYCGSCTRCMDACPTGALKAPKVLDARKCISYWTIEHEGKIENSLKEKFGNRIFGCDTCHDVCPWNSKASPTKLTELIASNDVLSMAKTEWQQLTEDKFESLFRESAIRRTGFENLKRNIQFIS